MADGGDDIFIFLGEKQFVPADVTHVIIDRSVKIIPQRAFLNRRKLVSVEMHDGLEKIEFAAFYGCDSLRGIKLPGVREIEDYAFCDCSAMTDVEFCDKLERIGIGAFANCSRLRRITIPLKDNMFPLDSGFQVYKQFHECWNLTTVDLVGVQRIHNTISSLLLESWKNRIEQEIDRINQLLRSTPAYEKTDAIRLWIESVINSIEHYKAEHYALLKEDMTQLELAVWKAKLDEKGTAEKKAKIDKESVRKDRRITSGADIVISNVLPFLQLAK